MLVQPSPPSPAPPDQAPVVPRCANCGAAVPGKFCGECGQRNAPRLVSVRRMLWDVLDDQLTLNSALPRTLGGLLLRPGFLTAEYTAGRIARYLAPFRLYLISSLAFFLGLALIADPVQLGMRVDGAFARDSVARAAPPAPPAAAKKAPAAPKAPSAEKGKFIQFGMWRDTTKTAAWAKPLARRLAQQEDRINAMSKGQAVSAIVSGMERNAPKAMFLLLPVFAFLLKILYVRRRRLYAEHFVFALHIHAFAFLAFSVMLATRSPVLTGLLTLWLLAYVFLAMRRVYGQGVVRTAIKYLTLGWAYSFVLSIGIVLTTLITTLTL